MTRISDQLDMLGFDETMRRATGEGATPREQARIRRRVETTHEMLSELPSDNDLSFLHSGLCQTSLPHSRPAVDHDPWARRSGRFSLMVQPGLIDGPTGPRYVGVPYGPKARLILIHLQTEGLKSRTVNMGASLSAFLRSLGLAVTGGQRGTIAAVREQSLRIARCNFTMQWTEGDGQSERTMISDARIVDRLELWQADGGTWADTVELSPHFHAHLKEHAVPLDKRGLAHLSGNSLGLDLYALMAYRLPRLDRSVHIRWTALQQQIGSNEGSMKSLAQRVREAMPDVITAYPQANVEIGPYGMTLKPSLAAVPKTQVRGMRLMAP